MVAVPTDDLRFVPAAVAEGAIGCVIDDQRVAQLPHGLQADILILPVFQIPRFVFLQDICIVVIIFIGNKAVGQVDHLIASRLHDLPAHQPVARTPYVAHGIDNIIVQGMAYLQLVGTQYAVIRIAHINTVGL